MLILPNRINDNNLNALFTIIEKIERLQEDVINIDASKMMFIEPIGICIFASLCEALAQRDQRLKLIGLKDNIKTYLSRMDLLKHCHVDYSEPTRRLDRASSLIEVHSISQQRDIEKSAQKISHCIVGNVPEFDENALPDKMTGHQPHTQLEDNLQYLFNELLENSLTHGRRHGYSKSNVCVTSQYFSSTDLIKLAIVDRGCGFLNTLRDHPSKPQTDFDAIKLALEPYTSCNRDVGIMPDSYNEGVGLTVISRMVGGAGGELVLFSGDAINKYKNCKLIEHTTFEHKAWSGVGISITLPRSGIKELPYRDVINKLRNENSDENDDKLDIQFI